MSITTRTSRYWRRIIRARRRANRALRFPRGAKREGKYVDASLGRYDGQWRL